MSGDGHGRGLVAVGDSITRGSGESMLGLRMQSWALWLAEALSMPYTCLAVDGARAADARRHQLPRLRGPYEVGCVYLAVNDVRTPGWDAERFDADLRAVAGALSSQSALVLMLAPPGQIGRPPAPPRAISQASSSIAQIAAELGALSISLAPLRGRELVLPDRVHLTARGQALTGLIAAERLRREGLPSDRRALLQALAPLLLRSRLRYAAGAGALASARDLRRRLLERHAAPGAWQRPRPGS